VTLGRREFLQRLGIALAALGISDSAFAGLCGTYQQALARPSRRLALLVGINQYPDATWQTGETTTKSASLQGARMDIELQRELLVNRFGVSSQDIFTLADEDATATKILETIRGPLAEQTQPGDTVVFHFSGLGSLVQLMQDDRQMQLPTLVTASSKLPRKGEPLIRDLFEETLAQALADLQGARVITVLDASATPDQSRLQGNFRVRSRLSIPRGEWRDPIDGGFAVPSKTATALAETWPGLLLRASQPGRPALEGHWHDFSAGVFTYALTQQIWSSFPAQRQQWIFHRVEQLMETWTGDDSTPQLQGRLFTNGKEDLLFPRTLPKPAADGIVKTVDTVNQSAILWLGGLPDVLLPYGSLGLRLRPMPILPGPAAIPQGSLTVKTIEGLRAKATLEGTEALSVGTPLVEIERRLPTEVTLSVALDPTLERIERVDATSALAGFSFVTTTSPGEQWADCLFGRSTPLLEAKKQTDPSSQSSSQNGNGKVDSIKPQPSYGLFSPDHTLLPGTDTEAEEAVKTAVGRLGAPLRHLLAVKILRLTTNPVSSRLPVRLSLETLEPTNKLLLVEETMESRQFSGGQSTQGGRWTLQPSAEGRQRKYRLMLQNLGQSPLYYLLVSLVERSRFSVYCAPLESDAETDEAVKTIAEASLIPANGSVELPRRKDGAFSLQQLQSREIFALICTQPFYNTWDAIQTADFREMGDRWATIPEPLPMAKAVLRDLQRASTPEDKPSESSQETTLALRSDAWATLSLRAPREKG